MTDDEYNEAKKLFAELGSIRKAATAKGKPYATFRRQFLQREQAQQIPPSESESQPATESQSDPDPASLYPSGAYDALSKMDVSRMAREGQERYRLDYYNRINRLNSANESQ